MFIKNESGAKLQRPELFRMLDIAEQDDAILIEQIDRITRLTEQDWNELKSIIPDVGYTGSHGKKRLHGPEKETGPGSAKGKRIREI